MSGHRFLLEKLEGRGATFEVFELTRASKVVERRGQDHELVTHFNSTGRRQVRVGLQGGSVLLEPGALQYYTGRIQANVQKHEQGGNFLTRAVRSAGTGESAFATRFDGSGEVWTEPSAKHFVLAHMESPADAMLLDDKAFYACEASIQVKTHVHATVSGMASGNGLMQPRLEGQGVFVVESPVPTEEIEVIELDGHNDLVVDGDYLLMYSATLQVQLRPLVRGLRNSMRSGEGLVYALSGRGTVFVTPTAPRSLGSLG